MPLSSDPDAALEQVRAIALELPETEQKASHGQPTFFAAGKMFAQFRHDHHGDGRTVVIVKTADLEEADSLIENLPSVTAILPISAPAGSESTSLPPNPIGPRSATESPAAGSWWCRLDCSRQAVADNCSETSRAPGVDSLIIIERQSQDRTIMEEPHPQVEEKAGVASAESGFVMLDGPDGVAVTMSPDAAHGTGTSLIAAAEIARRQAADPAPQED